MKALEDLFAKSGGRGITVIVIPPMGQENGDQVELGTPFSWGDAIAPDGRGDEDVPLDAPSDCSSFIANLIAHLTGGSVKLPALTDAMVRETEPISPDEAGPGDLGFMRYPGQGDIDYGHVGMLMDDGQTVLDQSTSDEGLTGRPGVDIRPIDHPFGQGGELLFRRVPGLRASLGAR